MFIDFFHADASQIDSFTMLSDSNTDWSISEYFDVACLQSFPYDEDELSFLDDKEENNIESPRHFKKNCLLNNNSMFCNLLNIKESKQQQEQQQHNKFVFKEIFNDCGEHEQNTPSNNDDVFLIGLKFEKEYSDLEGIMQVNLISFIDESVLLNKLKQGKMNINSETMNKLFDCFGYDKITLKVELYKVLPNEFDNQVDQINSGKMTKDKIGEIFNLIDELQIHKNNMKSFFYLFFHLKFSF